ncbi:TRAP transporter large permease [Desulfosporosinus sp. BICA1-9]|uniref:TRAP transporter large permease n=1 Tax=Desulfosporosinus sp. BICA1-9 TaxID=1531958 RepID=UPI00054B8F77|nr:TRAP transporter large permease [Desulfosporosinus sp. BICA1-9]KJS46384.1 MAG: C4-dicarboxylate ABC transporter permease [Peptococcaceae bacterium BRH_c23]KJS86499.1 MAG: C4-dicarboxylate ABC transporter permease [Desulfosporosinus sp. BICA1-9]HBW35592.1 TRAP transporter large permease [Desulfosporosinus sp.]
MSPTTIGFVGLIAFLVLMVLRMPIAISMGIVGLAGFSYLVTPAAAFRMLASEIYTSFASYSLSVIPMFVLMGYLAFQSGIGSRLYTFAYKAVGHFGGGLAMASQVACAIFGAVCGSSTATTATIGSIALPEMKKYHYNDSLATASVAAGGALGILIPPSTIFVIYGVSTEQSIAKLFVAGIIPGILLMISYMLAIYVVTKLNPALCPPSQEPRASAKEVIHSLRDGLIEVIAIFIISIGGLFMGFFTPTEAGAVGAAGVLLVTLLGRTMTWEKFNQALADTTKTTAMILFMVAGAIIFTRFLGISRIPFEIAEWVGGLDLPSYVIMLIVLSIYLFLGCIIEMIPLILLTIPIFYPIVVDSLGYDPIWFGVIICMVVAMGVITPPVGINVYVIKGVAKNVPLETVFRGVWPFLVAAVLSTGLLIVFPEIVTFLPNLLD